MTDNKIAAKELAKRHIDSVGAFHTAVMALRDAEESLRKARENVDVTMRQMSSAGTAFNQSVGLSMDVDMTSEINRRNIAVMFGRDPDAPDSLGMTLQDHRDLPI